MATNKKLLISKAENFTKTSIDLLKLNVVEKTADIISSIASNFIALLIVAMFVFFLNIGLAIWIGELLHSSYLGFLVIAAFYLLVALIAYTNKHRFFKNPISDMIVVKLLKNVNLDSELNPENYE